MLAFRSIGNLLSTKKIYGPHSFSIATCNKPIVEWIKTDLESLAKYSTKIKKKTIVT